MRRISIIIVNWNTGGLLKKCLEAIAALPEQELLHHVVVVDNASRDDSIRHAKRVANTHGYTMLVQSENLGFAKANNLGWKFIRENEGEDDHIFLLNPDTQVHAGALSTMFQVLETNAHAGIVGPKLLEANGETQPSVRRLPTFPILVLLFLKLHRIFANTAMWKQYMMTDFDYSKEQHVDQVMGAAFLIHKDVLHSIGLLDEAFWIWFDDVDYCRTAKNAGWNTIYTPSATVMHHKGASFTQVIGIQKTKPLLDSGLVYAKKHLGMGAYFFLVLLYPVALCVAALASLAHVRQMKDNAARL